MMLGIATLATTAVLALVPMPSMADLSVTAVGVHEQRVTESLSQQNVHPIFASLIAEQMSSGKLSMWDPEDASAIPGRYIVTFKESCSKDGGVAQHVQAVETRLKSSTSVAGEEHESHVLQHLDSAVNGFVADLSFPRLAEVLEDDCVEAVEQDYVIDRQEGEAAQVDCSVMGGIDCSEELGEWAGGHCVRQVETNGNTCKEFCQSKGLACLRGQNNWGVCEVDEWGFDRKPTGENGCLQDWVEQICVCGRDNGQAPSPFPSPSPSPSPGPPTTATTTQFNGGEKRQQNAPWHLDQLDGTEDGVYTYFGDGRDTYIYMIGGGVQATHEEFRSPGGSRVLAGADFVDASRWPHYQDPLKNTCGGRAPAQCNVPGEPGCNCGLIPVGRGACFGASTHFASLAAGSTSGVAKEANVVSVRSLSCGGDGTNSAIVAGIDYAVRMKQRRHPQTPAVIALPVGSQRSRGSYGWPGHDPKYAAIAKAKGAGMAVVVAAGNRGVDVEHTSPAFVESAITVCAVNKEKERWVRSGWGAGVDLCAPGHEVRSAVTGADNAYGTHTGTALASAQVAGAVAVLLQQHSAWSVDELTQELLNDCVQAGAVQLLRDSNAPDECGATSLDDRCNHDGGNNNCHGCDRSETICQAADRYEEGSGSRDAPCGHYVPHEGGTCQRKCSGGSSWDCSYGTCDCYCGGVYCDATFGLGRLLGQCCLSYFNSCEADEVGRTPNKLLSLRGNGQCSAHRPAPSPTPTPTPAPSPSPAPTPGTCADSIRCCTQEDCQTPGVRDFCCGTCQITDTSRCRCGEQAPPTQPPPATTPPPTTVAPTPTPPGRPLQCTDTWPEWCGPFAEQSGYCESTHDLFHHCAHTCCITEGKRGQPGFEYVCRTCQQSAAVPTPAPAADRPFAVGDVVRVRDSNSLPWEEGVVEAVNPTKVKTASFPIALQRLHVELLYPVADGAGASTGPVAAAAPPEGLAVGDTVEVRDGPEEPWVLGTVTTTSPLKVTPTGWSEAFGWWEVRRSTGTVGESLQGTDIGSGMRALQLSGAQVVIHEASEAARGEGSWLVTVAGGCSQSDMARFAASVPPGAAGVHEGNASDGLCVFIMNGTLQQMHEQAKKASYPPGTYIETDSKWGIIEPVPDPELGPEQLNAEWSVSNVEETRQSFPRSWGLDRIDDRNGLDNSYEWGDRNGDGVHVYVTDTGIRTTHRDFEGRAIPTLDVVNGGFQVCDASDTQCAGDVNGHGTHCAGTVGGKQYGVAKKATLHAVKVLGDDGLGQWSWFIRAIDWMVVNAQRPAIMSASLGGFGSSPALKVAIDQAVASGITVVVAAGNAGHSKFPDACYHTPAMIPAAITVGATGRTDFRAGFSSHGRCLDIFAPGAQIVSAGQQSDTAEKPLSGTSMACPHVAGALALIFGHNPSLTREQAEQQLLDASTKGTVINARAGSPNKFLYVGTSGVAPAPTPAPPPPATTLPPAPTPPSPVPPPRRQWAVESGPCIMNRRDGCITSPGFPGHYSNSQACRISVGSDFGTVLVTHFETEGQNDHLIVDGEFWYYGSPGTSSRVPCKLNPRREITWSSDESITRSGWRLCPATLPGSNGLGEPEALPPATITGTLKLAVEGVTKEQVQDACKIAIASTFRIPRAAVQVTATTVRRLQDETEAAARRLASNWEVEYAAEVLGDNVHFITHTAAAIRANPGTFASTLQENLELVSGTGFSLTSFEEPTVNWLQQLGAEGTTTTTTGGRAAVYVNAAPPTAWPWAFLASTLVAIALLSV